MVSDERVFVKWDQWVILIVTEVCKVSANIHAFTSHKRNERSLFLDSKRQDQFFLKGSDVRMQVHKTAKDNNKKNQK